MLKSDNKEAYCSNKFKKFCKKCSIVRQKSTPYTPKKNGITKRLNISLMEKVRSMLNGTRLA